VTARGDGLVQGACGCRDSLPISTACGSGRVRLGLGQGRQDGRTVIHLVLARPPRPSHRRSGSVPLARNQHPAGGRPIDASACSSWARGRKWLTLLPVLGGVSRAGTMTLDQPHGEGRKTASPVHSSQDPPRPWIRLATCRLVRASAAHAACRAKGCGRIVHARARTAGLQAAVDMRSRRRCDRVGRHGPWPPQGGGGGGPRGRSRSRGWTSPWPPAVCPAAGRFLQGPTPEKENLIAVHTGPRPSTAQHAIAHSPSKAKPIWALDRQHKAGVMAPGGCCRNPH